MPPIGAERESEEGYIELLAACYCSVLMNSTEAGAIEQRGKRGRGANGGLAFARRAADAN